MITPFLFCLSDVKARGPGISAQLQHEPAVGFAKGEPGWASSLTPGHPLSSAQRREPEVWFDQLCLPSKEASSSEWKLPGTHHLLPFPSFNPITINHSELPGPSQKDVVISSVPRDPEVICKANECGSHLSTPAFPKTRSGRHYKRHCFP